MKYIRENKLEKKTSINLGMFMMKNQIIGDIQHQCKKLTCRSWEWKSYFNEIPQMWLQDLTAMALERKEKHWYKTVSSASKSNQNVSLVNLSWD